MSYFDQCLGDIDFLHLNLPRNYNINAFPPDLCETTNHTYRRKKHHCYIQDLSDLWVMGIYGDSNQEY